MSDNEAIIRSILMAFGSLRAAAKKLGIPDSTVYFWVKKKNIPYWRRDEVLRAANKRRIKLTDEQKAFLRSRDPKPELSQGSGGDDSRSGTSEDHQPLTLAAHAYKAQ